MPIATLALFMLQLIETTPTGAVTLTPAGAAHLAELPLRCLQQEYPNKTGHTIEGATDARLTPKQLHPAFYGCFDWHSSVHGHWMLIRLLKTHPSLPQQQQIRKALDENLSAENLKAEAAYFAQYKLARTYERTYGWAWLLKLDQELLTFNDPQARRWHANLQPLTQAVLQLWTAFLPKQTYPNRTGVHPNTAFGLVFALDWARAKGDKTFEALIVQRARDYYRNNPPAPAIQEPDGTDFLSPSLEVCDLMRRVLPQTEFAQWFTRFMPADGLDNVLKAPIVSDRTDYAIVHLDGLFLSRAWCLQGIASALPAQDSRKQRLARAARDFINQSLPHVATGEYGGEHWLASFAVYALSQ
ncbi:MAG: DUF2891 domain-containing protein [Acidobacteria bacterium]|nr:DUF2891 domain-containing protein [Acidobacteriota bacterium]